jgi:hypothetical protein
MKHPARRRFRDADDRKHFIHSLLARFERGGLTRAEFAAKERVALPTLDFWRRQYGSNARKPLAAQPGLIEIGSIVRETHPIITILLGNGRELRVSESIAQEVLLDLVRTLES